MTDHDVALIVLWIAIGSLFAVAVIAVAVGYYIGRDWKIRNPIEVLAEWGRRKGEKHRERARTDKLKK